MGIDLATDAVERHLERSELCAGLSHGTIGWLAAETTSSEFPAGAILYEDRDQAAALCVVAQGTVSFLARAASHGEFIEVAAVGPGQFFGEGAVLDGLVAAAARSTARRARIICRERCLILNVPAAAVARLLQEEPVVAARNLLRHSAEKARSGSQRQFDDVIERETQRIFGGVVRWLARHTENAVTALRLQGDLLAGGLVTDVPGTVREVAGVAREFGGALQRLSRLAGSDEPVASWKTVELRRWVEETGPLWTARLADRGPAVRTYVEEFSLVTSPVLLAEATGHLLEGLALLASPEEGLEIKVGRTYGAAEFHVTARIPGLSEFTTLRLFQPFALGEDEQDAAIALALSRRLARLLGGDAIVKTRHGERLTVAITLPLHRLDAHSPA